MSKIPIDARLVSTDQGADLVVGTYEDGAFFLASSKHAPYPIRARDARVLADYIIEKLAQPKAA